MRREDRYLNKVILATASFIGFQQEKTLLLSMFHCVFHWRKGGIRMILSGGEAVCESRLGCATVTRKTPDLKSVI